MGTPTYRVQLRWTHGTAYSYRLLICFCVAHTQEELKFFRGFLKAMGGSDLRSREWQQEIPLTSLLFAYIYESLCRNELRNAKYRLESSCLGSHGLFGPVIRTVDYNYIIIYAVLLLGDGIDNSFSSGVVSPPPGGPDKWVRTQASEMEVVRLSRFRTFQLLRKQRTSAVIYLSHRIV